MGTQVSAKQWHQFKDKFPKEIKKLHSIKMPLDRSTLKAYWRAAKKKEIKFNDINPVSSMLAWCKECCEEQFYAERDVSHYSIEPAVIFYFFNIDDAMLFKLTWWNPNY